MLIDINDYLSFCCTLTYVFALGAEFIDSERSGVANIN